MTEHQHQKNLIQWARAQENAWPALKNLYAVPNGGDRHRVTAAKMAQEGVRKGVSDLVLAYPVGGYHGLYLEMKTPIGRLRPSQKRWLERMADCGYAACVAYGWEQGKDAIENYVFGRWPGREVVHLKARRKAAWAEK